MFYALSISQDLLTANSICLVFDLKNGGKFKEKFNFSFLPTTRFSLVDLFYGISQKYPPNVVKSLVICQPGNLDEESSYEWFLSINNVGKDYGYFENVFGCNTQTVNGSTLLMDAKMKGKIYDIGDVVFLLIASNGFCSRIDLQCHQKINIGWKLISSCFIVSCNNATIAIKNLFAQINVNLKDVKNLLIYNKPNLKFPSCLKDCFPNAEIYILFESTRLRVNLWKVNQMNATCGEYYAKLYSGWEEFQDFDYFVPQTLNSMYLYSFANKFENFFDIGSALPCVKSRKITLPKNIKNFSVSFLIFLTYS